VLPAGPTSHTSHGLHSRPASKRHLTVMVVEMGGTAEKDVKQKKKTNKVKKEKG
jgi:hypothetical protein